MQPSRDDLKASFADLSDGALLRAAANLDELTPLAQDVLREEMVERRLTLPASVPASTEHLVWNDEALVTVRRFRDLSEAIVARGALEAADIPCYLRNENTVRIDWQISNAIGGIRLDVLQSDVDAAEAVLLPVDLDGADVSEPGQRDEAVCPRCGSHEVHRKHRWGGLAMASVLFFGVPLPRGRKQWICDACGTRWNDVDSD